MSMSRVMESVYELELGNLISKLETENSVSFQSLEKTFCREVKEELFSGVCLSVSKVLSVLLKH